MTRSWLFLTLGTVGAIIAAGLVLPPLMIGTSVMLDMPPLHRSAP